MDRFFAMLMIPHAYHTEDVDKQFSTYCKNHPALPGTASFSRQDDVIVLEDCEAAYGEFEDLETWLIEHEIPFDRTTDPYFSEPMQRRQYRPATDTKEAVDITVKLVYGLGYMTVDELEECLTLPPTDAVIAIRELLSDNYPWVTPLDNYNGGLIND